MNNEIKSMKKIFLIYIFFLSFIANAQYTKEINSNRPSLSMGAYSVSKTILQIEGGLGYQQDEYSNERYNNHTLIDLQFRYGAFFEQLEFVADVKFDNTRQVNFNQKNNFNGFRQTSIGAKYMIYDSYRNYVEKRNIYSWKANQRYKWRRLVPAVSVYVGADFKGDENYFPENMPTTTLKGMIITQQHINNNLSFVTNLIVENATDNDFRSYGYIATLSYGFTQKWSFFAENQGFFRKYEGIKQNFKDDCILRGGFTYLVNKNLQLDISGGTTIGNTPHKISGQIGASWRTHKKYKQTNEEEDIL